MYGDQKAFDEAFGEIIVEDSLDDVIEKLAAVGVNVLPWQRGLVAWWLDVDDPSMPLPQRVECLRCVLAIAQRLYPVVGP